MMSDTTNTRAALSVLQGGAENAPFEVLGESVIETIRANTAARQAEEKRPARDS